MPTTATLPCRPFSATARPAPGGIGSRGADDALQLVAVGLDRLEGLGIRDLGLLVGDQPVAQGEHLRVLLLLPGDLRVDPLVVSHGREVAHEADVAALVVHGLGQVVHVVSSEGDVVEGLDVEGDVLREDGLVGEGLDPRIVGLLERCLERPRVVGNDEDGIHPLGDLVFHQRYLLGGVGLGRVHHRHFQPAELLGSLLHPDECVVEHGMLELADQHHLVRLAPRRLALAAGPTRTTAAAGRGAGQEQ